MSIHLDTGLTIQGVSVKLIRDILNKVDEPCFDVPEGIDRDNFLSLKYYHQPIEKILTVERGLTVAQSVGLIEAYETFHGPDKATYEVYPYSVNITLNPISHVFQHANLFPRISLKKADEYFNALRARINAFNADDPLGLKVEQVHLFGSYMRRADRVGDIDCEIKVRVPTPDIRDEIAQRFRGEKGFPPHAYYGRDRLDWYLHRCLFDGRKGRHYRNVFFGDTLLKSTGFPCQNVFSLETGWNISAPIKNSIEGVYKHAGPNSMQPDLVTRQSIEEFIWSLVDQQDKSPYR